MFVGLPEAGMGNSRKRFWNEDVRFRFPPLPGREDLEKESRFTIPDVPLPPSIGMGPPGGVLLQSGHGHESNVETAEESEGAIPKAIIRTVNRVSVRLQEEELWHAFGALQTEMIINRGGR